MEGKPTTALNLQLSIIDDDENDVEDIIIVGSNRTNKAVVDNMNKNNEERSKYLSAIKPAAGLTQPGERTLEFGKNGEMRTGNLIMT